MTTEQFCIVFNLFEHNPYLDFTYVLLKAVRGSLILVLMTNFGFWLLDSLRVIVVEGGLVCVPVASEVQISIESCAFRCSCEECGSWRKVFNV